jgi:hypothetical protein
MAYLFVFLHLNEYLRSNYIFVIIHNIILHHWQFNGGSKHHWEGGRGCRNRVKLNKNDSKKHAGLHKTKCMKGLSQNNCRRCCKSLRVDRARAQSSSFRLHFQLLEWGMGRKKKATHRREWREAIPTKKKKSGWAHQCRVNSQVLQTTRVHYWNNSTTGVYWGVGLKRDWLRLESLITL